MAGAGGGRHDRPVSDRRTSPTVLPLLAAGVVATAVVAMAVASRQRPEGEVTALGTPEEVAALDLSLRDELPWVHETSMVVYRPSGQIAVHVHEHGGLPGLVGPLDGPPMDRVDWQEPGGHRLRFHVHSLPGASSSQVTVKVAPPQGRSAAAGVAGLGGLDGEVRSSLAALRKHVERSR